MYVTLIHLEKHRFICNILVFKDNTQAHNTENVCTVANLCPETYTDKFIV